MATSSEDRANVYTRVTDQIIQAIEAGADSWVMPWHAGDKAFHFPVNVATGKRYRGVNIISLWAAADVHGYPEALWGTFKQWADLGHFVRKGEKASVGVFWKPIDVDQSDEDQAEDADREIGQRWMARAFPLFNAAQIEGYQSPELPATPVQQRIDRAEEFFAALGADIRHGGDRAFYRPATDHIQMPAFTAFPDPIDYYSTLAHEATHWTAAESRMARDLSGRFGSESYAAEELVAELGAAFISADLELSPQLRPDHAAYIQSWLKILKADNRAIFTASSHAQRATDYMISLQTSALLPAVHEGVPEPAF